MKEIQKIDADATEVHANKQIEKQQVHIGTISPHRGHTLFQINVKTLECTPAEFEKVAVNFVDAQNKNISTTRKVLIKPYFHYESALNAENAKRKFVKKMSKVFQNHGKNV